MPNCRLAERADFFAEVDVLQNGAPTPRRLWGKDLSESGIFLQTTHPFRVGDRVALRFEVERDEVRVAAAEVMWVRPFEPISVDGKMPGVGVKFLSVDPEHRAAIRRYVKEASNEDQETPGALQEGWLTCPPFTEPPRIGTLPPSSVTLPPATQSLLPERAPMPLQAISLPPFSMPPIDITMPPEEAASLPPEARVFQGGDVPAPPPLSSSTRPQPGEDTAHPLRGWSFLPEPLATDTLPERPAEGLALRFSDEAPARMSLGPTDAAAEDEAFSLGDAPAEAVCRDGAPGPEPERLLALEDAFVQGRVALSDLPVAWERRESPRARRLPALPAALALLGISTAIGASVGLLDGAAPPAAAATQATITTSVERAPLPVADAERPLVENPALVALVDAQPAPAAAASSADRAEPAVAAAPAASAPAPTPAPTTAMTPTMTTTTTPAPVAAAAPAPAPAAAPAKAAPAAAQAPERVHGVAVEAGRVAVPLRASSVKKAFALESPSRVVVDLAGSAELPKNVELGQNGVARVRTGHPEPGTLRVVIELTRAKKPSGITTQVKGEELVVAWK